MGTLVARIENINERVSIVSFDEPYLVNVCVILGVNTDSVFVLDTHLGPDSMEAVREVIRDQDSVDRPIFVFNSHADYDHVWGNCAFHDSTIIGHELCRARMINESEEALRKYAEHKRGDVKIVPPNLTFTSRLALTQESLLFLHTPGHTGDSSSCLDSIGKFLFVGDNVEFPIPYINTPDFEAYLRSLQWYSEQEWDYLVSSHDRVMRDRRLLEQNMEYVRSLRSWDVDIEAMHSEVRRIHLHNLDSLSQFFAETKVPAMARNHYAAAVKYIESLDTLNSSERLMRIQRVIE